MGNCCNCQHAINHEYCGLFDELIEENGNCYMWRGEHECE